MRTDENAWEQIRTDEDEGEDEDYHYCASLDYDICPDPMCIDQFQCQILKIGNMDSMEVWYRRILLMFIRRSPNIRVTIDSQKSSIP